MNSLIKNIGKDCQDIITGYVSDLISNDIEIYNKKYILSSEIRVRVRRVIKRERNSVKELICLQLFNDNDTNNYVIPYEDMSRFIGTGQYKISVVDYRKNDTKYVKLTKSPGLNNLERMMMKMETELENQHRYIHSFLILDDIIEIPVIKDIFRKTAICC
jgi:hypothetical protein